MFTKLFWKDALERAVKTAAHSAVLAMGALGLGAELPLDAVLSLLSAAGAGFVLSVLTSLASAKVGGEGASIVKEVNNGS